MERSNQIEAALYTLTGYVYEKTRGRGLRSTN